jgi:hypothetical protein
MATACRAGPLNSAAWVGRCTGESVMASSPCRGRIRASLGRSVLSALGFAILVYLYFMVAIMRQHGGADAWSGPRASHTEQRDIL